MQQAAYSQARQDRRASTSGAGHTLLSVLSLTRVAAEGRRSSRPHISKADTMGRPSNRSGWLHTCVHAAAHVTAAWRCVRNCLITCRAGQCMCRLRLLTDRHPSAFGNLRIFTTSLGRSSTLDDRTPGIRRISFMHLHKKPCTAAHIG